MTFGTLCVLHMTLLKYLFFKIGTTRMLGCWFLAVIVVVVVVVVLQIVWYTKQTK